MILLFFSCFFSFFGMKMNESSVQEENKMNESPLQEENSVSKGWGPREA